MTTIAHPEEIIRNGVPVHKLFATIGRLKDEPSLASFRFGARNRWIGGTASASTIHEWHGVGADHTHVREYEFSADHPTLGSGQGPTPQEYVLHALAACLTLGIATTAAARRIELHSVTSTVTGSIDVRGVLGIDPRVRNGFGQITVEFEVVADADRSAIEDLVESSKNRSAVYDMLAEATPIDVEVAA
jgi:uncharacterized OsmC-like protein